MRQVAAGPQPVTGIAVLDATAAAWVTVIATSSLLATSGGPTELFPAVDQ